MSFPAYPEYKESGVEWFDSVPEQWEVTRFPYAVNFQEGPGIMATDFGDEGVPLIRVAGVRERWATLNGCNYLNPEKVSKRWDHFRVNEGDLLISASASMGTVSEVGPETVGAIPYTGLIRLVPKPNRIIKDFIRAIVVSDLFIKQIDVLKAGATIQHFGPTHLQQIRIALPSVTEQKAIASFLDTEAGKIDALITEQEKLIELLKEKRQAVISHAVTKGLNPDAKMKNSGCKFIGFVPEHWSPMKIKYLFKYSKRQNYPDKTVLSVYRDFGVVKKSTRNDNFNKTPLDLTSYQLVESGDLVVNKMKAWQGSLGVSEFLGITSPDYVVFQRINSEYLPYLHQLLRSKQMAKLYHSISNGIRTAQWRVETNKFTNIVLTLPSLDEQKMISKFINTQLEKFDALIIESELAIELLKERRTALISAAVTGKIDVREFATQETV